MSESNDDVDVLEERLAQLKAKQADNNAKLDAMREKYTGKVVVGSISAVANTAMLATTEAIWQLALFTALLVVSVMVVIRNMYLLGFMHGCDFIKEEVKSEIRKL